MILSTIGTERVNQRLIETICPKFWAKPLPNNQPANTAISPYSSPLRTFRNGCIRRLPKNGRSLLPVDLHRSEASLLKFPNHVYGKPQTRDLSSQFHKLGDEQAKTVLNIFFLDDS